MYSIKKQGYSGKVGHTGTLDKFATGLLVVVTGWCTRLVPWLNDLDKRYIAEVRFGEETETLDPEGEIIATAAVPARSVVERVVSSFLGPIEQVPPVYSAVHTSGERAYKLARSGKDVDLPARRVTIHELKVVSFAPPAMEMSIHCSKGTYVRSLARDIGIASGSRAYLTALRRTDVGPFQVSEAHVPETISLAGDIISPVDALKLIGSMSIASAPDGVVSSLRNGQAVTPADLDKPPDCDGEIVVTDRKGAMVAIVEKLGNSCRYKLVVPWEME